MEHAEAGASASRPANTHRDGHLVPTGDPLGPTSSQATAPSPTTAAPAAIQTTASNHTGAGSGRTNDAASGSGATSGGVEPPTKPTSVTLDSFTCIRDPESGFGGGDPGVYLSMSLSGGDGQTAHVVITVNGSEDTEDWSFPDPDGHYTVHHGYGYNLPVTGPGTCEIDATTSTGPIHMSKQSN